MNPRHLMLIGVAVFVLLTAAMFALIPREQQKTARDILTGNPLAGRVNMVDRLDFIDSAEAFDRATMQHVTLATTQPTQIVLSDQRPKSFPRSGTWMSDVVRAAMPFTELIPSWNATVPPGTGVTFHVQTRDARSGEWSPWLYMGQWGRTPVNSSEDRLGEFDHGVVRIDTLALDRPADAYQIRATLLSFDLNRNVNPSIRRIAVSYSGQVDDAEKRSRLVEDIKLTGEWARSLPIPFRAQGVEANPLAGQVCSPTSTSMVMAWAGVDRSTEENALAIYDEQHDMFGNWNRAVQRAGSLGLDAWLTRFRNWDQVKVQIAQSQPVIASIKFKKGEFPSALYSETAGHLIVIRGFTKSGDVIVNDPASRLKGDGVVYKADELAHAWFGNGGVGYIIRKPHAATATGNHPATNPAVVVK
jgi:hypothetical protein